jgi:hypothetical protein
MLGDWFGWGAYIPSRRPKVTLGSIMVPLSMAAHEEKLVADMLGRVVV